MFNAIANSFLVKKKKKAEESEENLMPPATYWEALWRSPVSKPSSPIRLKTSDFSSHLSFAV